MPKATIQRCSGRKIDQAPVADNKAHPGKIRMIAEIRHAAEKANGIIDGQEFSRN